MGKRGAAVGVGAASLDGLAGRGAPGVEVTHTDAEWRQLLTRAQYDVLRREGTERAFTSPLDWEKRPGVYACAGCRLDLFSSTTKFECSTGWPSFWAPLDKAVGTTRDMSFGMIRTSVNCRRCGGHLDTSSTTARSLLACALHERGGHAVHADHVGGPRPVTLNDSYRQGLPGRRGRRKKAWAI